VKLGTSRKEHVQAGLKKIKSLSESFKQDSREARHGVMQKLKKLEKILPQDEVKILEDEFAKMLKTYEDKSKKIVEAKEKEINQA